MNDFRKMMFIFAAVVMLFSSCSYEDGASSLNPDETTLGGAVTETDKESDDEIYTVQLCDFSDSFSGARLTREYGAWVEPIDAGNAAQNMSMTILGVNRQGKLRKADRPSMANYIEYEYDDGKQGVFRVDEDGNLTTCWWETSPNNGKKLTQEECLQIAKDFLGDRIEAHQYQLDVEYREEFGEYVFNFQKYIAGLQTADMAKVIVLENGELSFFNSIMLGRIPSDTQIDFDQEKATAAVYAKLDALYAPVKDQYTSIEYELDPFQVTILESGETVLRCLVDVKGVRPLGDSDYYWGSCDRLELIIRNEV